MGLEFTSATLLGLVGVGVMFGLAVHAAGRAGSHGAGAFAAYSAIAGLRLFAEVTLPALTTPWATVAGVVSHLTTWHVGLLFLLFALRFAAGSDGAHRWRTGPFWLAGAVTSAIVVTNPVHGWYLRSPWTVRAGDYGPLGLGMIALTHVLVVVIVVLLAREMVRHEHRRAPLALVVLGVFVNVAASVLPLFAWSPFGYGQVDVAMRTATSVLFAVALFGFGLLRLVPVGRDAVLQRMNEGWLVLDPAGRIADLNPAAERLFGVAARAVVGRDASEALRAASELDAVWRHDAATPLETDVRAIVGGHERRLDVRATPVQSHRGTLLGRTLLMRDVTALRRAEAQALDRERALAALQERERVARELHDGVAQVLGFVRLQAEAARGLLRRDAATAEGYLDRLAASALEAQGEVRSFIAGSSAGPRVGWLAAIATALRRIGEETGLEVEFRARAGVGDDTLAQPVAAQVVRIVQEALHNVRKHARARRATLTVEVDGPWVQVEVADDGGGLAGPVAPHAGDGPATGEALDPATGGGFGIRFMHERAAVAGGTLAIASGPDEGTRVTLRVPRREAPSAADAAAATAVAALRGGG